MVKKYLKGYYFDTSERYKSNKGYFGKGVWKKDGKKIGLGVISTDDLGDLYQLNSDGTAIKIKDSKGITSAGLKLLSKKGLVSSNARQNTPKPEEDEGLSANIITGIAKKLGLDDNLLRLENSGIAGALTSGIIKSLPYFTPVGSLISGYDAIKNFRKGRWKEGLTDAAFVLPFIGGLGKLAKVGAKAYKPLAKPMAKTANRLNRLQKSNFSKFSNGFGLGMIGNDIYHAFFLEGGLIKALNGDKFNYFKKYAEEKKKVQEEQKQNGTNLESRWNDTLNKHLNNVDSKVQKEKIVRDKAVKKESRRRNNYVENVAGLQERLFKGGFYDEGTTFEQAVDGIMGSKTKKAMAREAVTRKSNTVLPTQINKSNLTLYIQASIFPNNLLSKIFKNSSNSSDSLESNLNAILEHKTKYGVKNNYAVVDKLNNTLSIYRGDSLLERHPITLGKNVGDMMVNSDAKYLSDSPRTTGAGVFTLKSKANSNYLGKEPMFVMYPDAPGKIGLALHSPASNSRLQALKNSKASKRVSYGCVSPDCGVMSHLYNDKILNDNDTVYVLPEVLGNKLIEKNGKMQMSWGENNPDSIMNSKGKMIKAYYNNRI